MTRARLLLALPLIAGLAGNAAAQTSTSSSLIMNPMGGTPAAGEPMAAPVMDNGIYAHALFDQFEGRLGGGQNAFRWEGQGWIGTDYNKLWLKSQGLARGKGGVEDGQHELLYDRAVTAYLDLQAGVRTDWDSGTGRIWAAFGVQGLAPLFFDYEATAYISDGGHAALKLNGYYDILLTQRLILQPQIELNFYSKADLGRAQGAGLSDIDSGVRLRYEISRKFAPYVGVVYAGRFGQTARYAESQGNAAGAVQFVFGVRSWF